MAPEPHEGAGGAPIDPAGRRPVRVLYLDNTFTFGGAFNSLVNLLRGLEAIDSPVVPVVVTGQPAERSRGSHPHLSVHAVRIRVPWNHGPVYARLRKLPLLRHPVALDGVARLRAAYWLLFHQLPEAFRYYRIGKSHDVDLVHLNNNLESQPAGILAAKLLRVPCIAHARGFQSPAASTKWSARRVEGHVAISHAIRENLLDLGIPEERVAVVPDGIDLEEFRRVGASERARIRSELGIEPDQPVFALFGRIAQWKGTKEFVAAAARVFEQVPGARALVVGDAEGEAKGYLDEVLELARRLDVGGRLLFTGYRTDVAALIGSVDLVVHASVEPEPFGMVVVEAMAGGRPVVATRAGGPRDTVLEGETGLLVPPADPEAMARAIVRLLSHREEASAMGARGRERAEARYSKERYARSVEKIYRHVLYGAEARSP